MPVLVNTVKEPWSCDAYILATRMGSGFIGWELFGIWFWRWALALVSVSCLPRGFRPETFGALCDLVCVTWSLFPVNGVPAEPKREMALCRHMRVSRPSGLSAGHCWLLTFVIAEAHRHRKMSKSYSEWIRQTTSYDSPWTLVFLCQKSRRHSNKITSTGAPNKGGVGSSRWFSTNISLYLRNAARYAYTCYGRLIGTVCTLSNGAIFNDLLVWPLATPNDPGFYILQHLYISVTG